MSIGLVKLTPTQDVAPKRLVFHVPGIPRPGGSKKAFWRPGMKHANIVDAGGEHTKNWRAVVALAARAAHSGPPMDCLLSLSVVFYMPRPMGHFGKSGLKPNAPVYHSNRPDCTKLLRSLEDACTGILWRDDSLIVMQRAQKLYTDSPGAVITVEEIATVQQ